MIHKRYILSIHSIAELRLERIVSEGKRTRLGNVLVIQAHE